MLLKKLICICSVFVISVYTGILAMAEPITNLTLTEEGDITWTDGKEGLCRIELFLNGVKKGDAHLTAYDKFNIAPLMDEPGYYMCKVSQLSSDLDSDVSNVVYPDGITIENNRKESVNYIEDPEKPKTGWKKTEKGWRWKEKDGVYNQGYWLNENGAAYLFDEEGYMISDQEYTYLGNTWNFGENGVRKEK